MSNYKITSLLVHARSGEVILKSLCSRLQLYLLNRVHWKLFVTVWEDYETRPSSLEEFGPARMQVLTLNLHLITASFQ